MGVRAFESSNRIGKDKKHAKNDKKDKNDDDDDDEDDGEDDEGSETEVAATGKPDKAHAKAKGKKGPKSDKKGKTVSKGKKGSKSDKKGKTKSMLSDAIEGCNVESEVTISDGATHQRRETTSHSMKENQSCALPPTTPILHSRGFISMPGTSDSAKNCTSRYPKTHLTKTYGQ